MAFASAACACTALFLQESHLVSQRFFHALSPEQSIKLVRNSEMTLVSQCRGIEFWEHLKKTIEDFHRL